MKLLIGSIGLSRALFPRSHGCYAPPVKGNRQFDVGLTDPRLFFQTDHCRRRQPPIRPRRVTLSGNRLRRARDGVQRMEPDGTRVKSPRKRAPINIVCLLGKRVKAELRLPPGHGHSIETPPRRLFHFLRNRALREVPGNGVTSPAADVKPPLRLRIVLATVRSLVNFSRNRTHIPRISGAVNVGTPFLRHLTLDRVQLITLKNENIGRNEAGVTFVFKLR